MREVGGRTAVVMRAVSWHMHSMKLQHTGYSGPALAPCTASAGQTSSPAQRLRAAGQERCHEVAPLPLPPPPLCACRGRAGRGAQATHRRQMYAVWPLLPTAAATATSTHQSGLPNISGPRGRLSVELV